MKKDMVTNEDSVKDASNSSDILENADSENISTKNTQSILKNSEESEENTSDNNFCKTTNKKLSDYVITLKILKKQEEKILKFTKRQLLCFGITTALIGTYTVTAFSQYLMNTKQELETNQKALQQIQLEKKQLETTKNVEIVPISDRSIDALAQKATELELKINELESIKINLNEQLDGVSQTAPAELTEAMTSSLFIDDSDETFTTFIKTTYNTDASVSNQLQKVQHQLDKTNLEFTSVATEAIETLSVYTDVPSGYPVENGIFSSGYDYNGRAGRVHKGIDITTGGLKLPIIATAFGTVAESGYHNGGYGNYVVIDHGNGYTTLYAHNSANHVSVGDEVRKGDVIATTGSTGMSTGIHCHYEVLLDGVYQNPSDYL